MRAPRPRPSSAPGSWPPAPEPRSVPCQPPFRMWKASLYFVQVTYKTAEHEIQTADSSPSAWETAGQAAPSSEGHWRGLGRSPALKYHVSRYLLTHWSGAPHVMWTEQSELCFLENTETQESNLFQFSLNYYIFPQFQACICLHQNTYISEKTWIKIYSCCIHTRKRQTTQ